jgi:hypothetical protein
MNLKDIDADFLSTRLGRRRGTRMDDEVLEVRSIVSAWVTQEKFKAAAPSSSQTKARGRKAIKCARRLEEAVGALDLPSSPMTDAEWPSLNRVLEVLDPLRVRALLWEIASACRWIEHHGVGRHASKRPNWPLGLAVADLVQFFHEHAATAVDNTAACDHFVIDTLMASEVVVEKPKEDWQEQRLVRDYLRKVYRDKSTGLWTWDPRGVQSS